MTSVSRLPAINREEIRRLRNNKINTVDELWATIGEDFDSGIARIEKMGIQRPRVIELLVNHTLVESESGGEPWLRQYWLEALFLLSLVGLVVLALWPVLPF